MIVHEPSEQWKMLYERCDPWEPAEAGFWVERPSFASIPIRTPAAEVVAAIRDGLGLRHLLISGTVGSGKSTEIRRIGQQLATGCKVVLFDVLQFFIKRMKDEPAIQKIPPHEVLILTGVAVHKAATMQWGHTFAPAVVAAFNAAASAALGPDDGGADAVVDLAGLATSMAIWASKMAAEGPATALGLLEAVAGAASVPLRLSGARELHGGWEAARSLLAAVNGLIADFVDQPEDLVVLLDGLDRVNGLANNERLWVKSDLIGQVRGHVVACASPLLMTDLRTRVRVFDTLVLLNVPVVTQAGARNPHGIEHLKLVYAARTADLANGPAVIPDDLLEELAYWSAGRLREFMELICQVAQAARRAGHMPAQPADLAVATAHQTMKAEAAYDADMEAMLQVVMKRPTVLPGRPHARATVTRAIDTFMLLPYPDGEVWWYPHTLLLRNKLRGP